MMNEERVREEIVKLEQMRMKLFAQLSQTEGALATMQAVLDPESLDAELAGAEVVELIPAADARAEYDAEEE